MGIELLRKRVEYCYMVALETALASLACSLTGSEYGREAVW